MTMKVSDCPSTFAVVLIMMQGKTLRLGGVTYGVSIRNINVELCPLRALTFQGQETRLLK